MAQRVLIGGGTGFIGKQLAHCLRWNGYEVTVVSRKPLKNGVTWEYIHRHGLPKRTASVINLAGESFLDSTKRWTDTFKNEVYTSRVKTTSILAKAIDEAIDKPCSFIVMSGVAIYPPSNTANYDEYSTVFEYDYFSKICHHVECAAELENARGCRTIKIRSGIVLGREGGLIKSLYAPYYFGLGGKIGSGSQFMPWIHIEDLIDLIVFCMNNDVCGVLNGVSPECTSNQAFTKAFAKAMGRPSIIPVPAIVMRLLYGKERANMITSGQWVYPKRTIEYNFKYRYCGIQEACKAVAYMIPKRYV